MSAETMSPAERLVRERDEARREYDRIESARRDMRLGRHVGQTARTGRLVLLRGVFGGGWVSAAKDEPIRIGVDLEREFYAFLTDRLDAAGERCRDLDARLASVDVPAQDGAR
jgi:hypothetical protein